MRSKKEEGRVKKCGFWRLAASGLTRASGTLAPTKRSKPAGRKSPKTALLRSFFFLLTSLAAFAASGGGLRHGLALRGAATGGAGGAAVPYQRIAYIRKTTGGLSCPLTRVFDGIGFEIEYEWTTGNQFTLFTTGNSGYAWTHPMFGIYCGASGGSKLWFTTKDAATKLIVDAPTSARNTVGMVNGVCTVNGETVGYVQTSDCYSGTVGIFGSWYEGKEKTYGSHEKVFWVKVYNGNSVMMNIVPVRIENGGWFYDTVGKKLYGYGANGDNAYPANALGPDVEE